MPQPPLDGDTRESLANLARFVASLSHPVPWNRAYIRFAYGDGGIGVDDVYRSGGFGAVPASGMAIAGLAEKAMGESEAGEKECAVCLEGYEAGDTLRTMPCSHGFHERCIFGWLRVSRLCPLCRFALPDEEETESDTEEDVDEV